MKILLTNSIADIWSYTENKYPSLGLGYIASYLKKDIPDIEIKITNVDVENEIQNFKPDIVGISSVSQNFNRAQEIASVCKELKLPVVIGGIHISSIPLCLNTNMDIGIIGEGEKSFLQVVKSYDGNWSYNNLSKIKGVVYRRNTNIETTPLRDSIDPLDQLPFPARDLLKNEGNEAHMFTSRGCPYKCIFCSSSRFWKRYRLFSAKYVVEEIKDLLKHYPHVHSIKMFDDLFIGNRKRLREIVRLIKLERIHERARFLISASTNLIDDEAIALFKEMNVTEVGMGLESGCERILTYLKKGVVSIKDSYRAIKKLKDNGIWVTGTFIIGAPGETKEDILETLNFIKKIPLDKFTTYVLIPFPNTSLWDLAIERELISLHDIEHMDWSILNTDFCSVKDKAPVLSEKLSRQELLALLKIFRKEERRVTAKWVLKLVISQPSKVINYAVRRIKSIM